MDIHLDKTPDTTYIPMLEIARTTWISMLIGIRLWTYDHDHIGLYYYTKT